MNGDNALQQGAARGKGLGARAHRRRAAEHDRASARNPSSARIRVDERRALTQAYRLLLKRAMRYRWYLEVQREAVGIRSHRVIDSVYPIPPPFSESA
jgi:hypothetical protein